MFRGCLNHYPQKRKKKKKEKVSPLNKGIGSHLNECEQNSELVRCSKHLQLLKAMAWIYACRPRAMRLCGMEVFLLRSPFHTVGKRRFFFCVFYLFFYSFFLLLFCFVSFFLNFWSQKSVVKMKAILYPDSLRAFPACFLNSLSLSISSQLVCLIFIVWTTWKMAQQKTVASILHFFFFACVCSSIMRLCACSEYLAAVHCKDLSNVLQEKTLPFGWACVHVLVWQGSKGGMLVEPAFTQGPKGWRVSSGSRGSKTSERRRKRQKRRKQRWVEMGRTAGRQMSEDFFFCGFFVKKKEKEKTREGKSTRFSGGLWHSDP